MINIRSAGLALGGGGARGWAHIGVILALADKNIQITHIAGTSIGAFVGAFYATNALDMLLKNVMHLDWKHGLGYFASVPSKTGMINGRVSANIIEAGLTQKKLAEDPPDILIRQDLVHISYLDFSKGEELIRLGYEAGIQSIEKDGLKVKN